MLKRFAMIMLMLVSFGAQGVEYTDVYFDAAESGWGVFLVQSDTTQFLAFFIYGADGKPTWYVAIISDNGMGSYTGTLYATTGTYFANPWQGDQGTAAGTATFTPIDPYHATLTYTVNGVGTVTKPIQRQTLTGYMLAGNYSGSLSGSVTGCSNPAHNVQSFVHSFNLSVAQAGNQSAVLTFTVLDANNAVCTLSGALAQFGRLYQIANATYQCPLSPATSAIINNFHSIDHGIEGRWVADEGGGCQESVHFVAVFVP